MRVRELALELAEEEIAKARDPNAAPVITASAGRRARSGKEKDKNLLSYLGEFEML